MNALKELWIQVWTYLKPIFNAVKLYKFFTGKTFLVLVVLVLFLMAGKSCLRIKEYERQQYIQEQNIAALHDSIQIEKTRSGQNQEVIDGLILNVKDLRSLNNDLYDEIHNQKGKVISLNKLIFQLRQDTIELRSHINRLQSIINQPIQLNDTTFKLTWTKRYDWDNINYDIYEGQTIIGLSPMYKLTHYDTEILNRISQTEITLGQKIEGDKLRVFVKSNYPGFTAESLQGILIDPNANPEIKKLLKMKHWIPNTWSVGAGPSFGFDFLSGKLYLGIGVQINYNILQW